ncbi:hypothetical protein FR483_n292L [Paramecium bursaria Chlorella virus FR483]|uniref:Uncharacterized protein n292L n=1 Tax=Paramecium bursaria Chlorella virus FR483 TaxID=399781 RepID=A7J6Z6_PBCVF|nr:hypothetical protein FR483_n292L [Paramecium bursaria Chlorella virus FR483]ABT15577.1 hypothetical protein FR483_n292L [Paramecium bursaria Chlorella virus FR483]
MVAIGPVCAKHIIWQTKGVTNFLEFIADYSASLWHGKFFNICPEKSIIPIGIRSHKNILVNLYNLVNGAIYHDIIIFHVIPIFVIGIHSAKRN